MGVRRTPISRGAAQAFERRPSRDGYGLIGAGPRSPAAGRGRCNTSTAPTAGARRPRRRRSPPWRNRSPLCRRPRGRETTDTKQAEPRRRRARRGEPGDALEGDGSEDDGWGDAHPADVNLRSLLLRKMSHSRISFSTNQDVIFEFQFARAYGATN
jgi:hypothetical protein